MQGQIVGSSSAPNALLAHATLWTLNSVTDLNRLGGYGGASMINEHGWIVGDASNGSYNGYPALWEPHTTAYNLGSVGGCCSGANGINSEGDIVGYMQQYGTYHALLWTHKHFTGIDLNTEISASEAKAITLMFAVGTNDRCMILADGIDKKTGAYQSYVLSLTNQADCNEP